MDEQQILEERRRIEVWNRLCLFVVYSAAVVCVAALVVWFFALLAVA